MSYIRNNRRCSIPLPRIWRGNAFLLALPWLQSSFPLASWIQSTLLCPFNFKWHLTLMKNTHAKKTWAQLRSTTNPSAGCCTGCSSTPASNFMHDMNFSNAAKPVNRQKYPLWLFSVFECVLLLATSQHMEKEPVRNGPLVTHSPKHLMQNINIRHDLFVLTLNIFSEANIMVLAR